MKVYHESMFIPEFLSNSKGKSKVLQTVKLMPVKGIFARKKKGKVERTYTTLGGAVSCIGMLDTSKKDVRKIFKYDCIRFDFVLKLNTTSGLIILM